VERVVLNALVIRRRSRFFFGIVFGEADPPCEIIVSVFAE
jgi:hypothetical protein